MKIIDYTGYCDCGQTIDLDGEVDVVCSCQRRYIRNNGLWELLMDVAQQPHYTQWKIQPITFIAANKLNFCQGNVIKYIMRYNQKNGLEDLKKAKVYIDYLIQELETGEIKP